MEILNEPLAAILNEANFDIEYEGSTRLSVRHRLAERCVSAAQLQEIYFSQEEQAVYRTARLHAPEVLMAQLVDALRRVLEPVVDPETDEIGHAFPIERGSASRVTGRADGLYDIEFRSSLRDFASAVVQAAAIIGVKGATRLLADWGRGAPVRIHMSTVLNNLSLSSSVSPRDDIQVVPLALTTTQLPRVPVNGRVSAEDYLGLTMLNLQISASPALFRPNTEGRERTVLSRSADGIDLDLVCEALSLQGNCHASRSLVWHDYRDAAAFCLAIRQSWSQGDDRLKPIRCKLKSYDNDTEAVTISPTDDVIHQRLNQDQLRHTLEALGRADKKLRIAVGRWKRSKLPNVRLVDAYIDLRIALESLYLKDFANEQSHEMRFRLALFGAWHLSADLDERRSIRKTLRNAYDTASKAVHLGEIPDNERAALSAAQDLCLRVILKLLLDGPPQDWGDVILGAECA